MPFSRITTMTSFPSEPGALATGGSANRALTLPALTVVLTLLIEGGFIPCVRAEDKDPTRVLDGIPKDSRLGKPKDLNGYFPMKVPASKEEWEKRRKELRQQVQVALGLWPMPEKTPLNPVVHGKIDRDDYTIEKVFFASCPGHYVSGNLYRPKGKTGKLPGVLFAHGHWKDGRQHDAGEKEAKVQLESKGEKTMAGAHYPLQALPAQLARMGCI